MTDSQEIISTDNDNDSQSHSIVKALPFSLDECYVKYFIERPNNKTRAYRLARSELGYESTPNDAMYAYALHKRLSERIQSELQALAIDDKALGRSRLRYLAENAKGESVQASTATTLYKSGDNVEGNAGITVNVNRDNVTITHKDQSITVSNDDNG